MGTMKHREINQSLTILAVTILPFAIALLVARGILVGHMLTAAHFENVPLAPGLGTHQLVSFALPGVQMVAFSLYFLLSSPAIRQQNAHLRKLAAMMWITVSVLELALCVPLLRVEAIYRLLMTASLILMDTLASAVVLEHLVCPAYCTVHSSIHRWWRNRR